jgi:hypothetical protein
VAGRVRAISKQALTVSPDRNEALGIEYYVRIAQRRQSMPDAILVLLDADDEGSRRVCVIVRVRTGSY